MCVATPCGASAVAQQAGIALEGFGCGSGNLCVTQQSQQGQGVISLCLKNCSEDADCNGSQVCAEVGQTPPQQRGGQATTQTGCIFPQSGGGSGGSGGN
jgi:hypothetical protein